MSTGALGLTMMIVAGVALIVGIIEFTSPTDRAAGVALMVLAGVLLVVGLVLKRRGQARR